MSTTFIAANTNQPRDSRGRFSSGGGGGGGASSSSKADPDSKEGKAASAADTAAKEAGFNDPEGGSHAVDLPQDQKRATIQQAGNALLDMGYQLGPANTNLQTKKTTYRVTSPKGETLNLEVNDIRKIVYAGRVQNSYMQLAINLTGAVRKSKLHGKDYLVANAVLIVPGVLNGSLGPVYYPADEIEKNPSAWNHVPIVLDHPFNEGSPVSARSPQVLENQGLGIILNAKFDGRLIAEAWFDVEAVTRVAPDLLNLLNQGQVIELSTGLGVDPDFTKGDFEGTSYEFVARNHRPDHLAVFLDKVGACSVDDGCGVLANEEPGDAENASSQPRDSKGGFKTGTSSNPGDTGKSPELKKLELQARAGVFDAEADRAEAESQRLTEQSNQARSRNDRKTANRFKREAAQQNKRSQDFRQLAQETRAQITNNQEVHKMDRDKTIGEIVANCSCWSSSDVETLNGFSDEKLKAIHEATLANKQNSELIANLASGITLEGGAVVALNESKDGLTIANADGGKMGGKGKPFGGGSSDSEDEEEEETPSAENAANRLTAEEQEAIAFGQRAMNERRKELIDKVVENISDASAAKERRAKLERLSIANLEEQYAFLQEFAPAKAVNNYAGANTQHPQERVTVNEESHLEVPVMSWS